MEWSHEQLRMHKQAVALLEEIKNTTFLHVGNALSNGTELTEYDVCQFVIHQFEERKLRLDMDPPIVAFGPSAAQPHYNPLKDGQRIITRGNVLLLDIWGKLERDDAPFADITWMAWTGGPVPIEMQQAFDAVLIARDAGLRFLEKNMHEGMKGREVDDVVRGSLRSRGLDAHFIHGTGHHLCSRAVHGGCYTFKQNDERELLPLTGATIEPGVYIDGKFGIRSECDIFLDKRSIEITSALQVDWIYLE